MIPNALNNVNELKLVKLYQEIKRWCFHNMSSKRPMTRLSRKGEANVIKPFVVSLKNQN